MQSHFAGLYIRTYCSRQSPIPLYYTNFLKADNKGKDCRTIAIAHPRIECSFSHAADRPLDDALAAASPAAAAAEV